MELVLDGFINRLILICEEKIMKVYLHQMLFTLNFKIQHCHLKFEVVVIIIMFY